jgi:hypothetical protein
MRFPAKNKLASKGPISRDISCPAPIGGWNTRDPQASMAPQYALQLDNFFPTAKTVDIRKGAIDWVTGLPTRPKHLMAWRGTNGSKLFACLDGGIYDVTATGALGALASPLTSGLCKHVNFNTTGGSFLISVNGVDSAQYFNGTVWSIVDQLAISGSANFLQTNTISFINSFKRALYFIQKNSMIFYYLPVDQILGSVSAFPLGALFNKGGSLIAMGNWTFDGGTGSDDYTVFVTSEGQVAVYKGIDPSISGTWALQGVYDLGTPLGSTCLTKFGGDLLYLSTTGLWSLSKALNLGQVKPEGTVSSTINQAFADATTVYGANTGWQTIVSPADNLLIVNIPLVSFDSSHQYVMNLVTQAWCRFTGWDATCFELMGDDLYMGVGSRICKAWVGQNDFGLPITAYCKIAPIYLSPRSYTKQLQLLRLVAQTQGSIAINTEVDVDFEDNLTYDAPVFSGNPVSLWGTALWNGSLWASLPKTNQDWRTVSCKEGYVLALRLRVMGKDVTMQWSSIDYVYEVGAIQG